MSGWKLTVISTLAQIIAASVPFALLLIAIGPQEDPITIAGFSLLIGVMTTIVTTVKSRVPQRG
jgi:hypothetical protein